MLEVLGNSLPRLRRMTGHAIGGRAPRHAGEGLAYGVACVMTTDILVFVERLSQGGSISPIE
jgi:hypothetical protein